MCDLNIPCGWYLVLNFYTVVDLKAAGCLKKDKPPNSQGPGCAHPVRPWRVSSDPSGETVNASQRPNQFMSTLYEACITFPVP